MTRQTTIERLRAIERAQLGVEEAPPKSNNVKYNTDYYGRPESGENFKWCVVFQWWCFQKAEIPTSIFPKSNRVFAVRDWFKQRNRFFPTPMVGDLVIFSRSHIGFVEKLLDRDRIQTIEGNSQNAVRRHIYPARAPGIEGYCRPQYHDAPAAKQNAKRVIRHEVVAGDTLSELAVEHRTTVDAIMAANRHLIRDRHRIEVGWMIAIPVG